MTSETHFLFDNVFLNTHSELTTLQEQIKEFQTVYQSNEEIVPFTNDINNKFNLDDESNIDKNNNNLNQKLQQELNKKDEEAQIKKLQTERCCILSVTARNETTTNNQKRSRLASEYIYEGIKICHPAFLKIYGFGDKYWNNIQNHFIQEGINPRIHKAVGKKSNFALTFEKVLEVISFITNYANIHGLPSPGQESESHIAEWNDHYQWAGKEREYYRNCILLSKSSIHQLPGFPDFSRPNDPNSLEFENHISWDYAEQIKIPYSSQQERNYLIKEEESIGNSANAVISFVYNYFSLYGLGETKLVIHADNCAGQNKNNAMIMYLAWRVASGLHSQITYSFIVAVDNLDDLVEVVEKSTIGGFNKVQTIHDKNKNRVVHFYNWTEFLSKYFKSIPNILQYHHFILHKDNIGKVEVKKKIDENTQTINIMKSNKIIGFPQEIFPKGLSNERKWYLYEQI
ncbi:hypothetical protein C1646_760374 [Rhizophagus diaphanus]|nr:hypothetical protein C1646_760374 [Rhizophagus diaphanus] [Rhizophagus sp. MUCL 43196]